jgi:hypothetical protein
MGNSSDCPARFRESLRLYVEAGIKPGSFLLAVLANNLLDAVANADREALAALPSIVSYVHWEVAPGRCHGSREVVDDWMRRGGLRGIEEGWQ